MDKKGLYLPVVEEFYSLQGEGYHTGKAAWFVRVGGCEVGCSFCDEMRTWNAAKYPMVDVDEIVARAAAKPARAVVVTGGEPLLYDMGPLTSGMHKHGKPEVLAKANELKVIIGSEEDFAWAEENSRKVGKNCLLLLQPDWNRCNVIMGRLVNYVLENPKWRVSLQSHKYMQIL